MRLATTRTLLLAAAIALETPSATTDIPAQLHMLGALVTEAPPTPSKLSTSLKSLVGDTSKLAARTPALQRALLWDAGQMWAGTADTYIDTYVLCGHSMNDVFLGLDAFDTGKCPLKPCKQFSFNLALSTCDASTVESETLCAVVAEDVVTTKLSAFGGPVWAQEGVISSAFVPQIYQNDVKSSNGTTTMFLISQNGDFKGTKDACGSSPSFVIPCRKVSRSEVTESAQERKWCHPTSQLGVQLWYQAETRTASGFSGGSSDSAISSTVDGGNTANAGSTDSSNGSSSTTTIILGAALGVAVIISGVLLFQICKRKDHSKVPPATPGYANASAGNLQQRSTGTTADAQGDANYSSSMRPSMLTMNIDAVNDGFSQQSVILAEFCDDQDLMMKRIAYAGLQFGKLIASGANGEVWRGEYAGEQVAIKRSLPEKKNDIKTLEMFSNEIRLASALEHPHIVRFIGLSWRTLPELCMVSEFMGVGDLSHFLASSEGKQLTWGGEKVAIAADVANALVYLHSLMPVIIHRDLKSLNILLTEDLQAKLSDFGLSREQSFETTMTSGVGTVLWTAPEVLRGDRYTEKADIYSFGIVLSELDTCLSPYSLNDEVKGVKSKSTHLMPLISKGQIMPKFSPECPEPILELATACLDQDPTNRPPAMQIVYTLRSKIRPVL